ncbi:MAG: LysM peptidoglycan-binding domain-containing protein [Ruminococcaceae bacterium]|nr:LysM peptidoglycan-binding domain-containing protein [Oscillospiraceae bacterium]
MIIHTVVSGDSIFSIAGQYGVPVSRIITDNMLTTPGRLTVGQDLVILFPTETYTVRGGDTLQGIAAAYNTDLLTLYRNNPQLDGTSQIFPGQVLNISYEAPPLGEISTNGYAYPFIDRTVLRRTLPYLTYLSVFSYGIRPDGTVFPPTGGDEELISLAREYGTVPLLVLTSLTENGTFSSGLARDVVASPDLSERVIEDIARTVAEKGYGGVDVDFEYVPGENAGDYADFVRRINDRLGDEYEVFVSLAPKYRADQGGLLYGGHDYGGLGAAADQTLLMTYEWGYTYGPPLAVSPVPEVRRVLDYAVTEIPRQTIFLGVPNYGYDWALPYVRGETKAESLGNTAAVERALEKNAEIRYDADAEAPFYTYFDRPETFRDAVEHIVWFEDAKSADAMLRLVGEYGIDGIGVWNIMRYFPSLWLLVNSLYRIRKR